MDLSQVSQTALLLLICRAVESQKNAAEYNDPMAVVCLERLLRVASEEDRRWISKHKRLYEGIQRRDSIAGVKRCQAFDAIADRFIAGHPHCSVINLGCGLDTRFWRIEHEKCRYIELDLPGVIDLKKELLKEQAGYEFIGRSVLDTAWIDTVTQPGNMDFLLIAEGLFMWFPAQESIRVIKEIGEKFVRSQLVLDMVPERYTRGIWKELFRLHSRLDWGLDVAWASGIRQPREIESYGPGLKVIGEEKSSVGQILTVSINAA